MWNGDGVDEKLAWGRLPTIETLYNRVYVLVSGDVAQNLQKCKRYVVPQMLRLSLRADLLLNTMLTLRAKVWIE